ncbi:Hpt domain-containing protein [Archangium sp.]|jgi:HPt (histidine-containing phosphotransfer) domain-containing protein|uniref:Hpt domain-containing protein n=1 Tax=Archangium sp. TaxID=1872627 RepID=UPI002ED8401B
MASSVAPLLDVSRIAKLRALEDEGEPGLVVELGRDFLTRASSRLARLRELLATGDAEEFELQAHSLTGITGMFGFMRLHELCMALEKLTKERGLEAVGELLAEAERAFAEARPLMLAELGLQE